MYITLYKQNKRTITHTNYADTINLTGENIPEYYKTTLYIPPEKLRPNAKAYVDGYRTTTALERALQLLEPYENKPKDELYYEFKIPKRSGGLRTIDAPTDAFKEALSKVKDIFEKDIKCLPHTAAYAYVKNTSVYNALEKHQKNQSNWYLKIDLENFFPNCNPDLIYNQLLKLYPFTTLQDTGKLYLKRIINICCLENGLPQGTPMSPLLTNLLMVPYDYQIHQYLTRGTGEHYVYTRYADDILISCKNNFNFQELQNKLEEILAPFKIKKAKTRYGSKAGSNWNLGLMLNKDNNITVGHRKKKLLNAMLNNFMQYFPTDLRWNIEDTQHLIGQLSYLKHIEPGYYTYIINKYNYKYNFKFSDAIKIILNPTQN